MCNDSVHKAGKSRRGLAIATALLSGWLHAAPAAAGTIGIDGNVLVVGAEASDGAVVLTGSIAGTDLILLTGGASFSVVTPGCTETGSGVFTCALSGFASLLAIGGSGNDTLDFSALLVSAVLAGGEGDDTLLGSLAGGAIYGGDGLDTIVDIAGASMIFSGPGDPETVIGGADLGEGNPVFQPLPAAPVPVPAPGSIVLLLAGFAAAALARRADSRRGSRENRQRLPFA